MNLPFASDDERFPRKAVRVAISEGDSEEQVARKFSSLATSAELAAYRVIDASEGESSLGKHIDVPSLLNQLRDQAAVANCGNLSLAEGMLINQATALQSLFAGLTERAMAQAHVPNIEAFMRMALRAQSQCRAALETLAAIKNPPIIYARQANVTSGPQQINNATVTNSRAREIENEQTQLSERAHGLLQDTRASGDASATNPTLETLGEVNRTKVKSG